MVSKPTKPLCSSRSTCLTPPPCPSLLPAEDAQHLEVNVDISDSIWVPLGGSVSIPCSVSLSSPAATSATAAPRIKWSVLSGDVEKEILVQRGDRVKVNDPYKGRAWLNDTSSSYDNSLWLGDLRSSDSGHYRCKVQQGLEDAIVLMQLNVIGNKDINKKSFPLSASTLFTMRLN